MRTELASLWKLDCLLNGHGPWFSAALQVLFENAAAALATRLTALL